MSVRLEAANSEYLDAGTFTGAQDITVGGWFKPVSLPSAGNRAPICTFYSTNFDGFSVGYDENGDLYIWDINGDSYATGTTTTLSTGTWYYLWVRYDNTNTEAYAYLDEATSAEVTQLSAQFSNTGPTLTLGTNEDAYGTDWYADVELEGWKVWEGDLAASEAANESGDCVMNTTTGGWAEWPLSDHNDLADQRNSNDLTASGTLSAGSSSPAGYSCGGGGGLSVPVAMHQYLRNLS